MGDTPQRNSPKHVLRPKEFEKVNAPPELSTDNPIEVGEILKENIAKDPSLLPPQPPPRQKSYRLRDWLLIMVFGNALFGAIIVGAPKSPYFYIPAISGMVILTLGVSWVLWGVMDKY